MMTWSKNAAETLIPLFRSLSLSPQGRVLDYGCGRGTLLPALQQALPEWEVHGAEISETALNMIHTDDQGPFLHSFSGLHQEHFDLIFSHHVLEHVQDLEATLTHMATLLTPEGCCFHVLPCGNPGSFEYAICALRKDGIELKNNNRFFFDEPGHLRRLTSEQLITAMGKHSCVLRKSWFKHQYYGALNWISDTDRDFICSFADPKEGQNLWASVQLLLIRWVLLSIHNCKRIAHFNGAATGHRNTLKSLTCRCLKRPATIMTQWVARQVAGEWQHNRHEPNGSEAFLFFCHQSVTHVSETL